MKLELDPKNMETVEALFKKIRRDGENGNPYYEFAQNAEGLVREAQRLANTSDDQVESVLSKRILDIVKEFERLEQVLRVRMEEQLPNVMRVALHSDQREKEVECICYIKEALVNFNDQLLFSMRDKGVPRKL